MKKVIKKWLSDRQKIINFLAIAIVLVIFSFVSFWIFSLYSLVFWSNDTDFIKSVVASFAGAFFAFLFLRFGEILEKYYQRQVKHFNALASMEIFLDEFGTIIHDNTYSLPMFRSTINSGNVYASILRPLPIRKDYYEELDDIKLINDLYKLNYDTRRVNDDLESANDWYLHLREIYTTGQMTMDHYKVNATILSENLKYIQSAHTLLLEDAIRLNAIVKMRLSTDKPLLTKAMHFIIDKTRQDIAPKQIEQKIDELKKEISESGEESQPRIEKLKKMAEQL